jgi:hypothetical protein
MPLTQKIIAAKGFYVAMHDFRQDYMPYAGFYFKAS